MVVDVSLLPPLMVGLDVAHGGWMEKTESLTNCMLFQNLYYLINEEENLLEVVKECKILCYQSLNCVGGYVVTKRGMRRKPHVYEFHVACMN